MPNLLTPGVYIQEVALGPSPIQGVSTSVAGFVGEAQRGPVSTDTGSPSLVTSFADFQRQYGGFVAGKPLAYAVQGFFDNGGQQAYIARVADADASYASVAPNNGYDASILSVSVPTVASTSTSFTIRASTVVGVADGTQITLIDKTGAPVGVVLTVQPGGVNTTAGTLLVRSSVAPFPAPGGAPLSPTAYALRYFTATTPQSEFTFTTRDPGSFGKYVSVVMTPVYLATALVQGLATPAPAYYLSTTAPFEANAYVELANAAAPSGRAIVSIVAVDPTTNKVTLSGGPINFGVGDYVRALGWLIQVYYNGVLVETLGGISSNNSGSDGLSSVNTNSQWVRVPTNNATYPTFAVVPPNVTGATAAVVTGTTNINTIGYNPGPLDGQSFAVATDTHSPVTVSFPNPVTGPAQVISTINAAIPGLASLTAGNNLQLTSSTIGAGASVSVGGTPAVLTLLGLVAGTTNAPAPPVPTEPAVVIGAVDISLANAPGLYGGTGSLEGTTLVLGTNTITPIAISLGTPAGPADVENAINSSASGVHATLSAAPANHLELTSSNTGLAAQLIIGGLSSPAALTGLGLLAGTTTVGAALSLYPLFPAGSPIFLAGGTDGDTDETDVIGSDTPPRSGLKALEATDGISIIAAPGWVSGGNQGLNDTVVVELIGQAERKQDRFAVFEAIDYSTSANVDVNRILAERGKWNSQYAAMYVPYVEMLDPLTNTIIPMPASGHVIGAYANTDNLRGVFKAPANVVIQNITGFSVDIPTGEQDLLNPVGVNVLRNFPGLGNVIWGARTIAADPLWKYISVRRLFIFIEQSLVQGTRYAVFEPNDLKLWARLRDSVSNFLTTQWRAGALFGATAQQSFFVRVDETTTTEDDQENGIVNILVGIAPVRPAEFIVFQIGQATESVIIAEQGGS